MYNFQKDFLSTFTTIMSDSLAKAQDKMSMRTKEFLIDCMISLVNKYGPNFKSGWSAYFELLAKMASYNSPSSLIEAGFKVFP